MVIYDTDGQIGQYEHRIQVACEAAGVRYLVWTWPPEDKTSLDSVPTPSYGGSPTE